MFELRDYQKRAIEEVTARIQEGHRRIVVNIAMGGGKTIICNEILKRTTEKGNHALFISHSAEINAGTSRKLDEIGVDHAFIQAGHKRVNPDALLQICMIQTLSRRATPPAKLIFIDECHLSMSPQYLAVIDKYPDAIIIGLTATTFRLSGEPLSDIYSAIVKVITIKELIASGSLTKPRTFIANTPDLSGVKMNKEGDYDEEESAELLNQSSVVSNIVENWQTHAAGRITIAFGINVRHSMAIAERFNDAGIKARHVDGSLSQRQRDETMQAWRDGEFTVLCNCMLYIAGMDFPEISCVLLCRPTASEVIFLQSAGRGLRIAPNKDDCLIMDCCSATKIHGFVQDERNFTLAGKTPRDKSKESEVISVHTCEECFMSYSKREHPTECPSCGNETPVEVMAAVEVELVEVTDDYIADLEHERELKNKRISAWKLAKTGTLQELRKIAAECGFKQGWAWIQYNNQTNKQTTGKSSCLINTV